MFVDQTFFLNLKLKSSVMGKMEFLFPHLPYDILIFTKKCLQNVTGKLRQVELTGPIRASHIVISISCCESMTVPPNHYLGMAQERPPPPPPEQSTIFQLQQLDDQVANIYTNFTKWPISRAKQGIKIHWTYGTSK